MAGVKCPLCDVSNTDGEALCKNCGFLLAEEGGPELARSREAAPDVVSGHETCPACGAAVPDPANPVCVECLEELAPRSSVHTRREQGRPAALRLVFPGQRVDVPRAGPLLLGRDPRQSPVAVLFAASDNVSRCHATVGIEPDGTAWVRDEHSTNGTFVNDKPVPGGRTVPLAHGDQLRMASDIVARVEFSPGGPR